MDWRFPEVKILIEPLREVCFDFELEEILFNPGHILQLRSSLRIRLV